MSSFPQDEFDRLLQAFSAIGKLKSRLQQQFWLSRTAAFHGLTRAEMRRLFVQWQLEQGQGGSDA